MGAVVQWRDTLAQADAAYGASTGSMREAGRLYLQARVEAGWAEGKRLPKEYKAALTIGERMERRAVQFYLDPAAHEKHKATKRKPKNAVPGTANLPTPVPAGEIAEAAAGFKAAAVRVEKCRQAREFEKGDKWRQNALQRLKLAIEHSNLPAVMGCSLEEIMNHLEML